MPLIHHKVCSGAALLATATIWLASVTLCSTWTIADEPRDEIQMAPLGHAEHSQQAPHREGRGDGDCGCKSFNAFPANTAALTKVPVPPASSPLYFLPADLFSFDSFAPAIAAKGPAPPGRLKVDALILRQCRMNHAPPLAA